MKPIYLDYNATTPINKEVKEAMLPYLNEHFGNPSSSHGYGIQAKKALENARLQISRLINCSPNEIIFTSGGTESNNFAIKGFTYANREKGNHIITSTIEHPAVIEVCKFLEKNGFNVSYISVDKYGMVNLPELEKAITSQTILITIMHANNEVGTIQPIKEISEIAEKNEIIFHTDAAQSVGKIPVDINLLGVDMLSIAGHKMYAPKGVGALYIGDGVHLENIMFGANQEQGLRPGTENILEIVGLGKACEIAERDLEKNMSHMREMRDKLHEMLIEKFPDLKLNGHPKNRLPNTLNVCFKNADEYFQLSLFLEIAASAGAACHSDVTTLSPVLQAMKVPPKLARGAIRFSAGKMTTEKEIKQAVDIIQNLVK
jgi:cysteine desulfurase